MSFFGELLTALFASVFRPSTVRWSEVLVYMYKTGVEALPILGLMSLLMGLVVAFMSSFQLQQFGAVIYVADLVGVGFVRELGSSPHRHPHFGPDRLGFCRGNRHHAGKRGGGRPQGHGVRAGAVPGDPQGPGHHTGHAGAYRLLHVFRPPGGPHRGGPILDISIYAYIKETQKALTTADLYYSLFKSLVYALIIAGIGCQRGFQVQGGAQEVGRATTSAVVTSLFVVIVTSSIFSIVQNYLK